MNHVLIFSPAAKNDILAALEYTTETWGEEQTDAYGQALNNGFTMLSENPYIGRSRHDISPQHRSLPIEKHISIYVVKDETVYISRVFHQSRDILQHEIPAK